MSTNRYHEIRERIYRGGDVKYHEKLKQERKLFVRDRLRLLLDDDIRFEDGLFANCLVEELPADGVVTGVGKIHGRTVCFMANDSTVKAGSWGARTVEKILRIQEQAEKMRVPLSGGLGRSPHHRSSGNVPWTSRGRSDFL
jgi:acetyl-CoA carboxylase carboxyltransferase component